MIINGVDINTYVGLPYREGGRTMAGCDCYGLFRMLYMDLYKIDMPEHSDICSDRGVHSRMILKEQPNWQEVFSPAAGDCICFKIWGMVTHIGMMVDSTRFVHAWHGADSCIESTKNIIWRHRIDGFFRHRSFCM